MHLDLGRRRIAPQAPGPITDESFARLQRKAVRIRHPLQAALATEGSDCGVGPDLHDLAGNGENGRCDGDSYRRPD
jgi:hypothetical protein